MTPKKKKVRTMNNNCEAHILSFTCYQATDIDIHMSKTVDCQLIVCQPSTKYNFEKHIKVKNAKLEIPYNFKAYSEKETENNEELT